MEGVHRGLIKKVSKRGPGDELCLLIVLHRQSKAEAKCEINVQFFTFSCSVFRI